MRWHDAGGRSVRLPDSSRSKLASSRQRRRAEPEFPRQQSPAYDLVDGSLRSCWNIMGLATADGKSWEIYRRPRFSLYSIVRPINEDLMFMKALFAVLVLASSAIHAQNVRRVAAHSNAVIGTKHSIPENGNLLVGTWRLIRYADTPQGGAPIYTFGKSPISNLSNFILIPALYFLFFHHILELLFFPLLSLPSTETRHVWLYRIIPLP